MDVEVLKKEVRRLQLEELVDVLRTVASTLKSKGFNLSFSDADEVLEACIDLIKAVQKPVLNKALDELEVEDEEQ